MSSNPGPGSPAHQHHNDLGQRLATICDHAKVPYTRRVKIGKNIYLGDFRCDLLVTGLTGYPDGLAVVARWQEGAGSADHKIPFLLACIVAVNVPTLIVLDGDYWRPVVWRYIARHVGGPVVGARTVPEFVSFIAARS